MTYTKIEPLVVQGRLHGDGRYLLAHDSKVQVGDELVPASALAAAQAEVERLTSECRKFEADAYKTKVECQTLLESEQAKVRELVGRLNNCEDALQNWQSWAVAQKLTGFGLVCRDVGYSTLSKTSAALAKHGGAA